MTSKTKIIALYSGVAIFSIFIVAISMFLKSLMERSEVEDFRNVGTGTVENYFKIEGDLQATNQDGQVVKLSDLNDKVWIITQFFANCPHCAQRNDKDLRRLYAAHKDDPNFQFICVTVDPDTDNVERLKGYAEALGADSKNWWFLTGDQDEMQNFLHGKMKFMPITKRTDPDAIAKHGLYEHDFGITVVRPGFIVGIKRDLRAGREMGDEFHKIFWDQLNAQINQGKTEAAALQNNN